MEIEIFDYWSTLPSLEVWLEGARIIYEEAWSDWDARSRHGADSPPVDGEDEPPLFDAAGNDIRFNVADELPGETITMEEALQILSPAASSSASGGAPPPAPAALDPLAALADDRQRQPRAGTPDRVRAIDDATPQPTTNHETQ